MKRILLTLIVPAIIIGQLKACTTAVISGKYTTDGKPMIWKLRDTESFKNKMMHFSDGKYDYVGLVNTDDIIGEQVWGGSNSKGFAIMNSASFNVNQNDTSKIKNCEGVFMKKALQECASLSDFEELLKKEKKPMGLAAHFGVLDAQGGVAFYEVNNQTFTKFDANDPSVAPNGYILRTNFSFTGTKDIGYGFIRYQTAQQLFLMADAKGSINEKVIMQQFSRCFKHSVLNTDFRESYENIPDGDNFINSGDLITRHGSASTILVKGVKKGQAPYLTTTWVHVGFPNTSVAMPVWVKSKKIPKVLSADKNQYVPLNEMALELKNQCYPIKRSAGYKYLCISKLINAQKTGYVQQIEGIEKQIFQKTTEMTKKWESKEPSVDEINNYYEWLDSEIDKFYKKLINNI